MLAVFRVHAARHVEHVPLPLVDVGPFDCEDPGDYGVRIRQVDTEPETVTGHHRAILGAGLRDHRRVERARFIEPIGAITQ